MSDIPAISWLWRNLRLADNCALSPAASRSHGRVALTLIVDSSARRNETLARFAEARELAKVRS